MPVAFNLGQVLGREDMDIRLTNSSGSPANAFEITFSIFYVSPGPPETEVLVAPANRIPVNPTVGEYYAAIMIPPTATVGTYRIRWAIRETANSPISGPAQEFAVVETSTATSVGYTTSEATMIRKFRIMARDHSPDRNYHFRPPEHEGAIKQFNQVFGYIWEDEEILEYLNSAVLEFSAFPPSTPGLCDVNVLIAQKPQWCPLIIWGALAWGLNALAVNWIAEEFSIGGEEKVQVVLPDGTEIMIPIEDLHEICHG